MVQGPLGALAAGRSLVSISVDILSSALPRVLSAGRGPGWMPLLFHALW